MNLFGMLEVSGSALGAERWRAEVVAANMANAETTRTAHGGAYRRQMLVFRAQPMPRFPLLLAHLRKGPPEGGVRVERVVADAAHQVLEGVTVEDTVHLLARHGSVMASYSLNQHQAPNEITITVVPLIRSWTEKSEVKNVMKFDHINVVTYD